MEVRSHRRHTALWRGRPTGRLLCLLSLAVLAAGCTSFDPARARREQTDAFTGALARLTEAELSEPLSLDDCVRIAMANNYDVRKADLDRELYRIGKQVAFTAFLPNVAAAMGYNYYAKDPQVTQKQFGTGEVDVTMPIFMPSTWFLYAAARHGYAAAGTAAAYVRQGIVLQTTVDYFTVLVQQDTIAAIESQLAAAREAADRIKGLAEEGFIMAWENDQALYQVEARQAELDRARRYLALVRGQLLMGMGLSPTADITLSGDAGEATPPQGSVEELVLKALEVHPTLAIADRQVVISEHEARQAFCDFLPTISLFSTGKWTGDDLAVHSTNWVSGFTGAWKVFDGLANVARYKAAKVERRRSELERESTFLSVMVQVIATEAAVHDAAEAVRIRQRAYDVAAAKLADYDARAGEGLITLSDALDARAAKDLAQLALVQSRYHERIAIAGLELAMGITLVPAEQTEAKEEK